MRTLYFVFGLLAVAARAQLIVGFDGGRGGSYNLQTQHDLRDAIEAALPNATFSYTTLLDGGALTGATGVVIVSAHDNINPVAPLSGSEQTALASFVAAGGFAIVVTDSDYTPTQFDVTNDSFLAPFGFSANGMNSSPITLTNPTANPIANGPFGLVTSLSGTATGSYLSLPGNFLPLGNNAQGTIAAGYFAPGSLSATSGAVLFIADGNAVNSLWAAPANYNFISNFVAFASVPEPGAALLLGGGLALVVLVRGRRTSSGGGRRAGK